MSAWVTYWLPEIGFVIRGRLKNPSDLHADVEAYQITNAVEYDAALDEHIDEYRMPRRSAVASSDQTTKFEEAQRFISGYIKWDGCSNLTFEDPSPHFCSREELGNVGKMLEALYDLAGEVIPHGEDGYVQPIHEDSK